MYILMLSESIFYFGKWLKLKIRKYAPQPVPDMTAPRLRGSFLPAKTLVGKVGPSGDK